MDTLNKQPKAKNLTSEVSRQRPDQLMMAAANTSRAGDIVESIRGIILRTSANNAGRYAYFPLSLGFPIAAGDANFDAMFADSLAAAPHFPNITILDSISCNILYQSYNSVPDFFHVYNLVNRSHFPISFPLPYAPVAAAIVIHECIHFKVLVVCIEEHPNPFFAKPGDDQSAKPLAFYMYSSKSRNWSGVPNPSSVFCSGQLVSNRRKPVHTGEDVAYLDLTDRFLIRFTSSNERIDPIPKPVSLWETDSIKLDEATRYGECRGRLHCAKFNPINMRVEIYAWLMEPPQGLWRLVVAGKEGALRGKVVALCPNDESIVFMRSEASDEIIMADIQRELEWIVIAGKGANCGQICFLRGMSDVWEAALEGGGKLKPSGCGILHPHENAQGPEGELFIVSISGAQLVLPQRE